MLPPLAVSVAVCCPTQIVALFTEGTIDPPIVTVEVAVAVHPATEVPVTVYTVVTLGLAVTVAPVEELSVDAGVHV